MILRASTRHVRRKINDERRYNFRQLVSITGIFGISFLITWFASVVNWAWEHEFSLPKIWKGISLYLGIFIFILLLGGAYLTFLPADSDTVRADAVTGSFDMDIEAEKCKKDVPCLKGLFNRSLNEFLQDSKQAADAGAKIIVWQENGLAVYQEDEASFIDQSHEFAMQEKVYLLMGMWAGAFYISASIPLCKTALMLIFPDEFCYLQMHCIDTDPVAQIHHGTPTGY